MNPERVPIRVARSILKALEAQGYNADDVLLSMGADFSMAMINDDDITIDAELYGRLYRHIMALLQDECFGLQLSRKIPAGTFRMTCLCIIHCTNLRAAIERSGEFSAFCHALIGLKRRPPQPLVEDGDVATMVFEYNPWLFGKKGEENILGIANAISSWRRLCSWLTGRNIEPIEILFTSDEPPRSENLKELFSCPVLFNQAINGFRFATYHLDSPLIQTEDSLNEFLRTAPFHLLARADGDDDNILSQMRRIVGNDFSKDFPSVTQMADALNMSVRTLRRRLKKEGLTFQQFKDNTRMQAAEQYLSRPELKINTVAALMGFDEPSAFHRSFKKWTSITPGDFRSRREVN